MAETRRAATDEAARVFDALVRRRDFGREAVRRLSDLDGAAEVLEAHLADPDPEVRRLAVRALSARGGRAAIAPLLNVAATLRELPTDEVAIALRGAVSALVEADRAKVAAFLESFAAHDDPFVRSAVADGLVAVRASDRVETLLRLAGDADEFVAERAVLALEALGFAPPEPPPAAPPPAAQPTERPLGSTFVAPPEAPPEPAPEPPASAGGRAAADDGARAEPRRGPLTPPRARPRSVADGPLRPPQIPERAPVLLQEPPETFLEASGELRRAQGASAPATGGAAGGPPAGEPGPAPGRAEDGAGD